MHKKLLHYLFNDKSAYDEGYDHGGYGMTVYFTPASITEGYYITNDNEAELYLNGDEFVPEGCDCPVRIGNRVNQETIALYQGLVDYFSLENNDGGGKPDRQGKGHKRVLKSNDWV